MVMDQGSDVLKSTPAAPQQCDIISAINYRHQTTVMANTISVGALGANFVSWLFADILRGVLGRPLYPRKLTSSAQECIGLKKRTLDVRFAPRKRRAPGQAGKG